MPTASNQIRVIRLTPAGRGAVASVLVEGAGTLDIVQSLLHLKSGKPLSDILENRLVVANFKSDIFSGASGEEIVVRPLSPQSAELHCHGGYAAVSMIEDTLSKMGCCIVSWQEWIAEKNSDPIAVAALLALADAPTERTAAILLDQYQGALSKALKEIETCINGKDFETARAIVDSLLAYAPLGLHLTKLWQVVLAGPPNAGKSSLINALVGFNRSIVHHIPGTTRDIVTVTTAMNGWPVELCDTAGLHQEAEGIELAGIDLAQKKISDADLIILVFDASKKMSESDLSMLEKFPKALVVYNKIDLGHGQQLFTHKHPTALYTSAKTAAGIDDLIKNISKLLVPLQPTPGAPVPFTLEQIERVRKLTATLR